MDITIISTGNLENYQRIWFDEYKKRCKWKVSLIEIVIKNDTKRIDDESEKILQYLENYKSNYIVLMEINGKILSTEELCKVFIDNQNNRTKNLIFIIGGAYGVNEKIKNIANLKLSFGRNTWPHNLMKVMLMEQIFRVESIIDNKKYHH